MFNIVTKSINWGGATLTLETGKVARQASGSVMVSYGKTMVLCTVVCSSKPMEGVDFLPLTVVYQEKTGAAGKFPGGFFKRETRPSEREVLISRLIDRTLRPTFPDNFYYDTQIICTVLSFDGEHDSDIPALIGASAAVAIAGIPTSDVVAASKVAVLNEQLVLNPRLSAIAGNDLDLVIGGTSDSVLMVESEVNNLSESDMLTALKFGHDGFQPVVKLIKELKAAAGKERQFEIPTTMIQLLAAIKGEIGNELVDAYKIKEKQERRSTIDAIKKRVKEKFVEQGYNEFAIGVHFKLVESEVLRGQIIKDQTRIDGRSPTDIRPIAVEVGMFPHSHGSALFTRGETQSICLATLGTGDDEQMVDNLLGESSERFLLHYNFPPYSVGEASPLRAPSRREVGHGKLAWRALNRMLPSREEFPYTIKVMSEITESNGSSSMATVCGGSLSMMDAGVKLKAPVAGIAMGLILEEDKFVVLSDILGDEDHLGDMDFKVAGTSSGITALQMDIKVTGITFAIMEKALAQAKQARLHILEQMNKVLATPREELNEFAPMLATLRIKPEKIREVIGSGGKVIRDICEKSESKIDIEDDGLIRIFAPNNEKLKLACQMIEAIAIEPEVGKTYDAVVVKITEYGAFVDYLGSNSGLVHVSEIADTRVDNVRDYLTEGQKIKVKLVGIDDRGKARLSIKAVGSSE